MNRKKLVSLALLLLCCTLISAQQAQKSSLQQRAEAAAGDGSIATTRFLYIRAFEDYVNKGQTGQGVECAAKATALYYKENYYKEAFDLLRRADQAIIANQSLTASAKAAQHYVVTKERMQMYMKLRKSANVQEQLGIMANQANTAADESLKNDLLYCRAIYYYTFGQTAQGNAVFKEMTDKLTAEKAYDKVDDVYKTLIANGRKSGSASLVAQSYSSYMAWKDSVSALKRADEVGALQQQIAEGQAAIKEKDSSLSTRQAIIIGLCILAAALAAVLAVGAVVLLRYMVLDRKQKKAIRQANENIALKAKFISNISAQLEPTLQRLDNRQPEVQALLDFSRHVQTLSELERTDDETAQQLEDTPMQPFCEDLMNAIQAKVRPGVSLTVSAPKMGARIHREYVSHILSHLLSNAAEYTPSDGKITLEFKKRSAHTYQFLVTNTGESIPEEKREDVFKAFVDVKDLTKGDGLGLPICRQMALKMNGDLDTDTAFTKGTRFVLNLSA